MFGDWTQNAIMPAQQSSFGLVDAKSVPLDPDHPLEDFDLFSTFFVTSKRELGLPVIDVLSLTGARELGAAKPVVEVSVTPSNRWFRLSDASVKFERK